MTQRPRSLPTRLRALCVLVCALWLTACSDAELTLAPPAQSSPLDNRLSIQADVSIGPMTGKPGAFGIAVAMAVSVPGMDKAAAEALVKAAHEVCPYSNATRGNIDVALSVV